MGAKMNIKEFRKKYGLSREDLASKVGVSYMTVYRWEKKKVRPHRVLLEKLERIIRGYNV